MDSEQEISQEDSKEEDAVELSDEEWPVYKRRKVIKKNPTIRTKFAVKAAGGRTSTFILEDNLLDSIIYDLEGVRSRIMKLNYRCNMWGK